MEPEVSREDRRLMRRRGAGAREMKDRQFGFILESLPDSLPGSSCTTGETAHSSTATSGARADKKAQDIPLPKQRLKPSTRNRLRTTIEEEPQPQDVVSRTKFRTGVAPRELSRDAGPKIETITRKTMPSKSVAELFKSNKDLEVESKACDVLVHTNGAEFGIIGCLAEAKSSSRSKTVRHFRSTVAETEKRSKPNLDLSERGSTVADVRMPRKQPGRSERAVPANDEECEHVQKLWKDMSPVIRKRLSPKLVAPDSKRAKKSTSDARNFQGPIGDSCGSSRDEMPICKSSKAARKRNEEPVPTRISKDTDCLTSKRQILSEKRKANITFLDESAPGQEVENVADSRTSRIDESHGPNLNDMSTNVSRNNQKNSNKAHPDQLKAVFDEKITGSRITKAKREQKPRRDHPPRDMGPISKDLKSLIGNKTLSNSMAGAGSYMKRQPQMTRIESEDSSSELEDYGEVKVPVSLKSSGALVGKWRF